jgi:hypothetical protein
MSTTGLLLMLHTLSLQVNAAFLKFNHKLSHDLLVLLILAQLLRHSARF